MEYQSKYDAFNKGNSSPVNYDDEESKKLESYRDIDVIRDSISGRSDPKNSSANEKKLHSMLKNEDIQLKSMEYNNDEFTKEAYKIELDNKKYELEANNARIEALNANETLKRLKDKLAQYAQENNMYRVEIEAMKRQVDIADSNAKMKEEEALLAK
jgi:hypothetical protein